MRGGKAVRKASFPLECLNNFDNWLQLVSKGVSDTFAYHSTTISFWILRNTFSATSLVFVTQFGILQVVILAFIIIKGGIFQKTEWYCLTYSPMEILTKTSFSSLSSHFFNHFLPKNKQNCPNCVPDAKYQLPKFAHVLKAKSG